MTQAKKKFRPIPSKSVLEIYNLLHSRGYVSFPITQEAHSKVDALVSSINSSYYGNEIYKTSEEKAVAHLYFIIKDHPFTDGNKRTAVLVFETLCFLNELEINYSDFDLGEVAVFLEKLKEDDYQMVIKVLAKLLFK